MDPYRQLALVLAEEGIRCQFQSPGQLVVSGQVGPVWPHRGNSFWVTHAGGRWSLFTWVPRGYSLPEEADIAELCRVCMQHGTCAMYEVPLHIIRAFGLNGMTEEQADAVYAEMDKLDPHQKPNGP